MNFEELKLNRFGYKNTEQDNASNQSKFNDMERDQARNILTGTVITSCFIRTSDSPARVEMSGNDIRLYDDSKGGNNAITGDTSSITFARSDELPGSFVMQKRHGKDYDTDNIMEMFFTEGDLARFNYFFLGRRGDETEYNTNYIELIANSDSSKANNTANGKIILTLTKDGVQYKSSIIALVDGSALETPQTGGARAMISGEGNPAGGVQLTYFKNVGSDPTLVAPTSYIVLDKDGIQYSQSGRVSATGVASAKFPSGWSVAHPSTGIYTITHNLGHTLYAPIANAIDNGSAICGVRSIAANSFQVGITSGGAGVDCAFSFAVF